MSLLPVSTPLVSYHKMTKEDELSDSEEEEGEEEMKEVVEGGTRVEKNFKLKMRTEKKQKGTFLKEKVIIMFQGFGVQLSLVSSGQNPWRVSKQTLKNRKEVSCEQAGVGCTQVCF